MYSPLAHNCRLEIARFASCGPNFVCRLPNRSRVPLCPAPAKDSQVSAEMHGANLGHPPCFMPVVRTTRVSPPPYRQQRAIRAGHPHSFLIEAERVLHPRTCEIQSCKFSVISGSARRGQRNRRKSILCSPRSVPTDWHWRYQSRSEWRVGPPSVDQ